MVSSTSALPALVLENTNHKTSPFKKAESVRNDSAFFYEFSQKEQEMTIKEQKSSRL